MTTSISTIVGELFISGNESFITEVTLEKKELTGSNPLLDSAKSQLSEYFEARRKVFDLPLDLSKLTSFQKKVLQCCAKIPYGETLTYKDIALLIGNPRASRAVGNALHNNPIMIIIPCHRVLAKHSDGGFAFGLEVKSKLLKLESGQK